MTINLKKCISENIRLTKSFGGDTIALTGTLRARCSVSEPVIVIETSSNISAYNYAEIPDLGRNYFITDIVSVSKNLWEIHLRCDVLSTYASEIRACTGIVSSIESKEAAQLYVNDGSYFVEQRKKRSYQKFANSFSTDDFRYVLITCAG